MSRHLGPAFKHWRSAYKHAGPAVERRVSAFRHGRTVVEHSPTTFERTAAGVPTFVFAPDASPVCANRTPVYFAGAGIDAFDWCHRDGAFTETARAKMPANRTQDACAPTWALLTDFQCHAFNVIFRPRISPN